MTIAEAFQNAVQLHQSGRLAEAERLYREILAAQPGHADALHLLGVLAQQAGRSDVAVDLIGRAVAANPAAFAYHHNLGSALHDRGLHAEAVAAYGRAIGLKPDFAEAHNGLGVALRDAGRPAEAAEAFQRAIALRPDYAGAHSNLGSALLDLGEGEQAVASLRLAVRLRPDHAGAHNNLGVALIGQGCAEEAASSCRRALECRPDFPEAHNSLGNALRQCGRPEEAVAAYRRALELRPGYAEALNNLGVALGAQGRPEEAAGMLRRAVDLRPGDPHLHSSLVYSLQFLPDADAVEARVERQRWNAKFGGPHEGGSAPREGDRASGRRLRVGYVSADFRDHVIGRNLLPLFQHHDRSQFEVFCYSGALREDAVTGEFRARADCWQRTAGTDDDALAALIRGDGVDILVDLTQHLAENRLPVFARRPAPVQASFAGYPETTGLGAIGHRISDRHLEGGRTESGSAHERLHLLESFWCYDPRGMELEPGALPARTAGFVTFGSLNNFCKVNAPLLRLWARVLRSVEDSRLLLLCPPGSHRQHTLDVFAREGIAAERVLFAAPCPRSEYLALFHGVDIVLDSFPYGGHTTGLDALWMGVPVVTLAGSQPVSRAGLSQLLNLGLAELAAHAEGDRARGEAEYAEIARRLANDLDRLSALRAGLRARMEQSVLMDAARFTRGIEDAYREMWRCHCEEPAEK